MNKDSLPEEFEMPSYEEVMSFAKENGYSSRINVAKFYQYYSKTGFIYKGLPMDWKKKMSDWAETEKGQSKTYIAAAETKHDGSKNYWPKGVNTPDEMKAYLRKVVDSIRAY